MGTAEWPEYAAVQKAVPVVPLGVLVMRPMLGGVNWTRYRISGTLGSSTQKGSRRTGGILAATVKQCRGCGA